MGARFVVLGETEAECADGLAELCEQLGAVPTTRPCQATGGRWIARAVPKTKAPVEEGRG
ncbi:hypothetical protein [Streptomyces sp. NRRL B-24720]|uniref:hypothetical protein n=1 Tax=Streptomyces sp. NRRL B-24720 TaxID=1476876 RepID=UPI0004C8A3D6|nr:hypothetical protein [Streptomyces sp. NRRL B-24720]